MHRCRRASRPERVRLTFATGVATDRTAALALARKYRDVAPRPVRFPMAFTMCTSPCSTWV
jgi:hypothetical protein